LKNIITDVPSNDINSCPH